MNAFFRKDYLYKLNSTTNINGTKIRYQGFDRIKKEYIFTYGIFLKSPFKQITLRVPNSKLTWLNKNITKLKHMG
jgi:hypothetical protein